MNDNYKEYIMPSSYHFFSWYKLSASFIKHSTGKLIWKTDMQNGFYVLNFGDKTVIMTNFCINLAFLSGNVSAYSWIIVLHEDMLQVFKFRFVEN